ncbi:uncharacterized protein E0L32_004922 [Thyridium curvatum]|uniref:L-2-hydroxyglutarate dehydrogenase, mitochondrial n=1 Tax=Thyridium curvatum TaxID=1093900 RepID=A0A507AYM7_9PEZI|nr:uncharacterized protein E0L32_004922 [Thyridium curvatum]TPX15092.1 hypothetical protein E0L32_004922 [Thyridium curvatum]
MFATQLRSRLPILSSSVRHRTFSATAAKPADFTHAVIGGGVVGLAVARALAAHGPTVLLERHTAVGTETSARNSEVIHAGIYYGADSLKARLCIRGKQQLYDFCAGRGVAHARTGKWLVAQTPAQRARLDEIHALCRDALGVPTRWVGEAEAARREPGVAARAGVLESPSTGIVDSHGLMTALLADLEDRGGELALGADVVGAAPLGEGGRGAGGWEVRVRDRQSGEESAITSETLVNAAGLGAAAVHNMIAPSAERRVRLFFAKGNYFSYSGGGSSVPRVKTLIYPVPEPGLGGLGTHLTLDLAGRMRFGPDVEWVDSPDDLAVNAARLPDAVREIKKYLPGIDERDLTPDYAGIRPKLSGPGSEDFADFIIRKEEGYEGWISLLGIESPGLTSSLAIGEMVEGLLYK